MSSVNESLLNNLQAGVTDPSLGLNIGHKIKERDITLKKSLLGLGKSSLHIKFQPGYYMSVQDKAAITQQMQKIAAANGFEQSEVEWIDGVRAHRVQTGLKPLSNVKNILAVASGKGGVGKSTTSVNLALALAEAGAKVGILDADIYGPSQPLMLGVHGQLDVEDSKMVPKKVHGICVNSIGFLISDDAPAILRGPMVAQALEQMLLQTAWPDLDYLVVDMPPGTGDIALTLSQKAPLVGSVIITTPQDVALIDARKAVGMFQKVHVPVLGLVENMSVFVCPNCGHAEHLFGDGGGRKMAAELKINWLGDMPLTRAVCEQADSGRPTMVSDPESAAAQSYRQIARMVALQISSQPLDHSAAFPKVVVQSS